MAHQISYALDKAEGGKPTLCINGCKNFRSPHQEKSCVLSEVYSYEQGKPCYIFDDGSKEKGL